MRIPISSPSKSTSREPSAVLYFDVISTSPRSMEPNTSRRNTTALSSTSLIFSGSLRISIGLPCFGALSCFLRLTLLWSSWLFLTCRLCFEPWKSLQVFPLLLLPLQVLLRMPSPPVQLLSSPASSPCRSCFRCRFFLYIRVKGFSNFFSSLIASSFTDSTSSSISLHIRNWLDSANFDHGRFAADSEESGAAFTDNLNIKLVTGSSKLKTRFCDSFILCFAEN